MRFEIGAEARGTRLDVFLSEAVPELTRSQLQALNRRGGVRVDGRTEKAGYRLRGGELVEVDPESPESSSLEPESIPLDIHYEDAYLAVVEKPAGMVVHPGAGNRRGTLVHALMARFPELSDAGGIQRPGIVHRIDKGTSGLLVVAKTNLAHERLSSSFQARRVKKSYLALVHGRPPSDSGTIELAIGRHPSARTRMAVRRKGGRSARSDYRVVEQSPRFSLLEIRIHTGRTHQIRVHMGALGSPIVGDSTYGEKAYRELIQRDGKLGRLFLHASGLELPHPVNEETLRCVSPLPGELRSFWKMLRSSDRGGRIS